MLAPPGGHATLFQPGLKGRPAPPVEGLNLQLLRVLEGWRCQLAGCRPHVSQAQVARLICRPKNETLLSYPLPMLGGGRPPGPKLGVGPLGRDGAGIMAPRINAVGEGSAVGAGPSPRGPALSHAGGPVERLKSLITKVYLTSRASMLILGPPGAGKSSAVFQSAEVLAGLLGRKLVVYSDDVAHSILSDPGRHFVVVDLRLTEVEASDLIGVPRTDGDYVLYKPLLWARVMSKVPGIVFLDEITNVQDDTVLAAAYKILLDRRVGFVKLDDGVMVVAAGNTPEHASIARELPAPQVNRTIVVSLDWSNEAEAVKHWLSYMEKRIRGLPLHTEEDMAEYRRVYELVEKWRQTREPGKLYGVMAAFLTLTRRLADKPASAALMENFPTPRTWELLYWTLTDYYDAVWSPEEQRAVCVGLLGTDVGTAFWAWLRRPLPNIEHLIEDPEELEKLETGDLLLIGALAGLYLRAEMDRMTEEKARKVGRFLEKLVEKAGREVVLVIQATIGTDIASVARRVGRLLSLAPQLIEVYREIGRVVMGAATG